MISRKMFHAWRAGEILREKVWSTSKFYRTFLSEAYKCEETWNHRLTSPLLQKIKPINFYIEIDQKYSSQKQISAVDIDIFANSLKEGNYIDELSDLLHKLRLTPQTTYTLDSTYHAVVRYCLKVFPYIKHSYLFII